MATILQTSSLIDLNRAKGDIKSSIRRVRNKLKSAASLNKAEIVRELDEYINNLSMPQNIIEERFRKMSTHTENGNSWTPLKQSTMKNKVRKGYNPTLILVGTGFMKRKAVDSVANSFHLSGIRQWDVNSIGCSYAKYNEEGTSRIPKRSFMQMPNRAELRPMIRTAVLFIKNKILSIFNK